MATGSLWRELPDRFAGGGSFGWPALQAGRWWTLASSLVLTRNTFMALSMALAVAVGLGVYERMVGPGRALAVALVGHVTGSVVVALGVGALGRTGWTVAERAAANLDYGASMVVAAALGAIASRSGDRRLVRLAIIGPPVVLLLHHQLADWAHLVACPAGFLVDGARKPRRATVAAFATAALTGWLVLYGPAAVIDTTNQIRFWRATPAAAAAVSADIPVVDLPGAAPPNAPARPAASAPAGACNPGPSAGAASHQRPAAAEAVPAGGAVGAGCRGRIEHFAYTARALGDRPAVATLYVPAGLDRALRAGQPAGGQRVPVVLFLHGIPGAPEDWLAGGGLARRLDAEIAAGTFPAALAVVPESATMHDPKAGWVDEPHQSVLSSLRDDLLPAVARRFPAADLDPGHVAAVGVGRGADGALQLAGLDRRFGYAVGIGPETVTPPDHAAVILLGTAPSSTTRAGHRPSARTHWARWRADLPGALHALSASGFGRPAAPAPTRPARAGGPVAQ